MGREWEEREAKRAELERQFPRLGNLGGAGHERFHDARQVERPAGTADRGR
jgi:hypothetical protein